MFFSSSRSSFKVLIRDTVLNEAVCNMDVNKVLTLFYVYAFNKLSCPDAMTSPLLYIILLLKFSRDKRKYGFL